MTELVQLTPPRAAFRAFFCLARNLPTGEHAFPMFDRPLSAVDYILRY
jgi:hypothetical protein